MSHEIPGRSLPGAGEPWVPPEPPSGDLYELLQVSRRASPGVIQAAYRVLARNYHPDVYAGPEAVRIMRRLNAAYHVLSDSERRARYDASRPWTTGRPGVSINARSRRTP